MAAERLLVWRHGRTEWNATGRVQGQADIAIDAVGLRQAQQAAQLLASERPEAIVSSDLVRTLRTAEVLGELVDLPVAVDPRLRERHFGPWEGLTGEEIAAKYPEGYALWRSGGDPNVAGVETEKELNERITLGVEAALTHAENLVCVVTHGGTARRMVLNLLDWPQELAWRLEPLGNCRWAELRHSSRGWRLHSYNAGPSSGAAGPHVPAAATDVEPST